MRSSVTTQPANRNAAVAIRSAQSIVFNPSNTVVVATTLPLSTASASGGMPVTYDSWTPSTCNVSAATLSISGWASYAGVRASQVHAPLSGGGSLAPAPQQLRVPLIVAPPPILDIDSSGAVYPIRCSHRRRVAAAHSAGYRGAALVASDGPGRPARRHPDWWRTCQSAKFDVDGDGQTLALTDGIAIQCRMLGITSAAAVHYNMPNRRREAMPGSCWPLMR